MMTTWAFSSVASKAAATAIALTIVCGGIAFADVTGPTDPTPPPPTTTTITPTPPPAVSPDGHPWID
jgi:hypothetical protein